nr:reverse transcriptase domain-containing protein [Tanacetum cinerariifolium]
MPRECLKIIESKSKVRQSRAKEVVAKVGTSSSTPAVSSEVAELKDLVRALLLNKKNQSSVPVSSSTPAPVKAGQNVQNQLANLTGMLSKFMSSNTASSSGSGTLPSNTIGNSKEELKGITTRSGVAYQGPTNSAPSKVVKQGTEVTKDQLKTPSSQSTAPVQPLISQSKTLTPISEPIVAPVSALMPNVKSSIPYPSRRDNERRRDQANEQIEKFYEIFKDMSFEISFTDALILMPTLKALIGNKEKLSEMARTSMNEHCSVVILNKLPRKLGDPGKFLIPCEFLGMDECLALADLGASINLMPFSVWEALLLSKLTPNCMTLELADSSVSKPIGIAKDVSFKVGVFHFPADFVVVDFEPDPRVPLIFGRCFLKTDRALIDVHKEILNFSDTTASGNSTPHDDPIVSTTSPTLTPFGDSDFLLFGEADAFLGLEDDPDLPKINPFYFDPEGDILLLKTILNSKPLPPLPNHEQYLPSFKKELKVCEAKTVKSFVNEPPEVELKDLPPHLEYAFLEGDNKLPVIISKELGDEEKSALIKDNKPAVQHQRRVNPKIHDVIKKEVEKLLDAGLIYPISDSPWVSPTMEVFMDEFSVFGSSFENYLSRLDKMLQRCENTNLSLNWEKSHFMVKEGIVLGHKISKNEIEVDRAKVDVIAKLPHPKTVKDCIKAFQTLKKKTHGSPNLDCPKLGPVKNEGNELIPTRLVTGWRVCIDYQKLNEATRKDHFPLPFMDQILERLAGNEYYRFLDGFSGCFQIPIDPHDQEKTTFTCPYGTFTYRRMPFGLCNASGTFQRNSFENCLSRLDKMLQRCEDTKLCLNWEKIHFMVKEGIVLGHKISKNGLEVDKAKVDVITKLPHPITVKCVQSFLGHAGFYRRFIKDFSKISRPMTHLLKKDTPFIFSEDCIKAFKTLKQKLTEAPILIAPNWDLPFELMCNASDFAIVHTDHSALKYLFAKKDAKARLLWLVLLLQEFDFKVLDTKGAENLAADHLSRLENN